MSPVDAELDALRRPFRIGLLAVVAVVVAIGGVIAAFGSSADRPAGIAERWLVAVSDTTREGVRDDALARMDEHQVPSPFLTDDPVALFPSMGDDHRAEADGKARFDTIRVGRPVHEGVREGSVLVPVEVTPYDTDDAVDGYVVLTEDPEAFSGTAGVHGWKVVAFGSIDAIEDLGAFRDLCPEDRCLGFPIERPERAPIGFWFGTFGLGLLIAVGCSAAVRAATPGRGTAGAAAS